MAETSTVQVDLQHLQDYQLLAEVGTPSSLDGMTRVTLQGSGRLVVEWERSDPQEEPKRKPEVERREETGELGQDPAPLFERTARFAWDQEFPPRPGLPDEAIIVWELRERDRPRGTVKAWLEDAERDPLMAPVLEALREGTARLTGGDVYL